MIQLALEPRAEGERLGALCLSKAEDVAQFDSAGAARFIVAHLIRYGDTAGEVLVDEAMAHGYRPHEQRAFGPVFAGLSRKGLIRTVGYCLRTKGHSGSGGRIWAVTR
jgi:hypothetical protein